MNIKKNDVIEVEITGMTSEGNGVGRYEGTAIFIPDTAEGDRVRAIVVKLAKNYAFGKAVEILTPSPDRIETDCEVSRKCGGCVFRHISYNAELKIKAQRVKDALTRIGGFENLQVEPIVGAQMPDFYRNKAQLPVRADADGNPMVGFFAPRSHRIIDCGGCKLSPAEFEEISAVFTGWMSDFNISPYNEEQNSGTVRHLYLRKGFKTGEIMVCVVSRVFPVPHTDELVKRLSEKFDCIKSIVINVNPQKTNVILGERCVTLFGRDYINDYLCGLKFKISPLSFYQVNRDQAERLYGLAAQCADLRGDEVLLDLYCGTGTIGLSMAKSVKKLIGVEIVPQAIEDAKKNAAENGIENARFICADAAKAAVMLAGENISPDVVILDPPRKGCSPELLETVAGFEPEKIVYVSCDPATLARDMKILNELDYSPKTVIPVDMFPRTSHVEAVVLMTKR
ncbi:MAG: 23S rRNA (uracil(1939)-C(5))-methyltransferase RlmD [Clostridia bacterium]|nr:23S rRNA (uracil(1939)-C(5))-methyltransferase RlmD [Clostridia bacterium]